MQRPIEKSHVGGTVDDQDELIEWDTGEQIVKLIQAAGVRFRKLRRSMTTGFPSVTSFGRTLSQEAA
jgi:hypothetical protein